MLEYTTIREGTIRIIQLYMQQLTIPMQQSMFYACKSL